MKEFEIRTDADSRKITAERMEFSGDSVRFYTEGRVVAAFARYLWAEEVVVIPEAVPVPEACSGSAGSTEPEVTE